MPPPPRTWPSRPTCKDVIDSVTFWGATDADSWLQGFPVRNRPYNQPLLFDGECQPKECFRRVVEF